MRSAIPRSTAIAGVFSGYRFGAIFRMQDGTFWRQASDHTHLHHAVDPVAEIHALDEGLFLKVDGIDAMVLVRQLFDVIVSRINGKFTGWTGRSTYRLTNGQTWQQAKYLTKYVVKYMPEVLIYQSPAGPMMQVAGTTVKVRQIG